MALLLCGASLLRQLATKLHKKCKKPASSASASASGPASAGASGLFSVAAAATSSATVLGSASSSAAGGPATTTTTTPTTLLRTAAAAARAAGIIPRKVLPTIPFCSDDDYALAKLLGMKAPPVSFWTLPPVNPSRISALSRDGNPPAACSSLSSIEEGEEPVPEPTDSAEDDGLSVCLASCPSLRPSDHGTDDLPPVDPLFRMLWAKVQKPVGEDDSDDDDDDDDDDSDENCSCLSCHNHQQAVQEKCSAYLSLSSGALAHDTEPTFPSSSVRPSCVKKDRSEPVGVEQALDSSFLRPAPLSIRKKVVETPPAAHQEPMPVLVTYNKGAHSKLHPTLEALCAHYNA